MAHTYTATIAWTGNLGEGTSGYRNYKRDYDIEVEGKPIIAGSADAAFRGDKSKYNPEDMLLSSLSSCHMLWYLHLCADNGIIVTHYIDHADGIMEMEANGSGAFKEVTLNPTVTITDASKKELAEKLHHQAKKMCFIANSVNFEVKHNASIQISENAAK